MYLSRFEFNTARRGARDLLSSPQKMHGAVMAAFPPAHREPQPEGRVLWRVDQYDREVALYLVSPYRPDLTHLTESAGWPTTQGWDTRRYTPLLDRIALGDRWHFRLTANPARSVRREAGASKTRRSGHVTVDQQTRWFLDRSQKHGFTVTCDHDEPDVAVWGRRTERFTRQGGDVTVAMATFEGQLEVTDPAALRHALAHGIGAAKAYGCGLLTLAR
jgi:CRISPR system Cascade subunit CasE